MDEVQEITEEMVEELATENVELLDEGIEFYGLYGNEEGPIYTHREVIVDNIEERIVEIAEMLKEKVSRHG